MGQVDQFLVHEATNIMRIIFVSYIMSINPQNVGWESIRKKKKNPSCATDRYTLSLCGLWLSNRIASVYYLRISFGAIRNTSYWHFPQRESISTCKQYSVYVKSIKSKNIFLFKLFQNWNVREEGSAHSLFRFPSSYNRQIGQAGNA